MAKIIAPSRDYNGVSAGVRFINGQAECNDAWTNKWFKEHGYTVEEADEQSCDNDAKPSKSVNKRKNKNKPVGVADEKKTAESDGTESESKTEANTEESNSDSPFISSEG